ncbi:GntR family transcriptional regulator [Variovorax sp. J22R24]|uniref:GntR family transcriptional regulator n=1 Tax=Variovorax gracilis TaxID=3053502 RepID=UPI0025785BD1|nr:GntR family transcriptional regulator [Variovorax sp. J22R24]MDM0106586.1 GntR family transcriptional regulator [Variovorax sp. J22R24]
MAFVTKLDQVAEKLRERIIAGEYARGEKLKQVQIAEELGVSVTPVREALKALEMEGYIVSRPHQGLSIPEFDLEDAQEILELRMTLERQLTRRAVERLTKEGLESLHEAQRDYIRGAKANDLQLARRANVRFHFRLYELAERPQTLQFVRVLWAKYPFITSERGQTARAKVVIQEHNAFLKFAGAGEVDKAVDAMCSHIGSGWDDISMIRTAELAASRDELVARAA